MVIEISVEIKAPLNKVWMYWNDPKNIVKWNFASSDWHTTKATNNLIVTGKFSYRMEAKDNSFGFDFGGTYTKIIENKLIEIVLDDNRKVKVQFEGNEMQTTLVQNFETEDQNEADLQKIGWQNILNNFKSYSEKQM